MLLPFQEWLDRLRTGDADSVRGFVEEFEPFIRRSIRLRLNRLRLQAAADSGDVCQSVMGVVLVRIIAGDFQFDTRNDLERLLTTIMRRKFAALARFEFADRRDRRRGQELPSGSHLIDPRSQPSDQVMVRDLFAEVRSRLSDNELALLTARQAGQSWEVIAKRHSVAAPLLRKRLSRALNRVSTELGFEAGDE